MPGRLETLAAGQALVYDGNRTLTVSEALAKAFQPGDHIVISEDEILHLPAAEVAIADAAVTKTHEAFGAMQKVTDDQITQFFNNCAKNLDDEAIWAKVRATNDADVAAAKAKGRSTTRLEASEAMRQNMKKGLLEWAGATASRGKVVETINHGSWKADLVGSQLGVVAFVFEGRPNVVTDATGVLRGGNTVVFRIGRDALNTAKTLLELAVAPALVAAGLPAGAVSVVDSAAHAAGWALFRDRRLALAVARGSGKAVDQLGGIAQAVGTPVSLHGTGGAWLTVGTSAVPANVKSCVADSLDRKVCNTVNCICVTTDAAVPFVLEGLALAAERRNTNFKLHVVKGRTEALIPSDLFTKTVTITRAEGDKAEVQADVVEEGVLAKEWEWEHSPEVTIVRVDSASDAARLCNAYSPQFVACLLSEDAAEHESYFQETNTPFVGDGFTRWVDGQYCLKKPELGLSNWANGRLFGRAGVLTGDSVYTLRIRVSGTSTGKPQ